MALMYGELGAPFFRQCAARFETCWEEHARRSSVAGESEHVKRICVRGPDQWHAHRRILQELAKDNQTVHLWCASWAFPLSSTLSEWKPSEDHYSFAVNVRGGTWAAALSLTVAQHSLATCRARSGGGSCCGDLLAKRNKVGDLIYSGLSCLQERGVETSAAMRMVASGLQMLNGKTCDGMLRSAEVGKDFDSVAVICLQAGVKAEWTPGLHESGASCLAFVLQGVHACFGVDLSTAHVSSTFAADIIFANAQPSEG